MKMPTGYTAAVQDGTISEFPAFAMQCARAFGALITMRDDPNDAPIPEAIKPSQHYSECADKARSDMLAMMNLSAGEVTAARDAAEAQRQADQAKREHDRMTHKARYEAMLAKAMAWIAPTPEHVEIGQFMVQQLKESIKFDCTPFDYQADPLPPAEQWIAEHVADLARSIARYEAEQIKENERAANRTAWITALRQSLGAAQ